MVPWPIALLTLFYGAIAALSAATVWHIMIGVATRSLAAHVGWLILSAGAMCGLPLLKPWGRSLAMATSLLLMGVLLAMAALVVGANRPWLGLATAMVAAMQMVPIRYLQRPQVKQLFRDGQLPDVNS